jgi:hypothetical protein
VHRIESVSRAKPPYSEAILADSLRLAVPLSSRDEPDPELALALRVWRHIKQLPSQLLPENVLASRIERKDVSLDISRRLAL